VIESTQDGDDCWATKFGYRVVFKESIEVIIFVKDGKWGVKNGKWGGIN